MIAVTSSNVASVGFEEDVPGPFNPGGKRTGYGTLYITFRNGWTYKYKDAPRWLYEGLLSAGSKGRYVWTYIRRSLYPTGVPYGSWESDGYVRIQ